ncbi:uncharacterized protein LOC135126012 [Zophobas morio]|uniref:uncharacterized protein LOC135126012 n=1 Tax=Zophobas morio TaxID=2755281 RepID=UPI00308272A9
MAFGKSSDVKRIKNAVLEDRMLRTHERATQRTNKLWKRKWGWVLDEYEELHRKLEEISKTSEFLNEVNKDTGEKDRRSIAPVPQTTNHQYGWIPSKPEFGLEKYGPDVDKPPPLPPNYGIFKGV